MGLDITAYSDLQPTTGDEDEYDLLQIHVNSDFPGRCDEFKDGEFYSFFCSLDFRAGSYGTYNWWRNELAKLAGYEPVPLEENPDVLRHDRGAWKSEGGPFWELINFSDCEGTLGTAVCAKLHDDFIAFDTRAQEHCKDEDNWFYHLYMHWLEAFELAREEGCVCFH